MSCPVVRVVVWTLVLWLYKGASYGLVPHELFNNETFSESDDNEDRKTTGERGPIFVHIGTKEITIPCKPAKSGVVFGLNPTYNWTKENGGVHYLSDDATLTIHAFTPEDSGRYTCTISFMKDGELQTKVFFHTVAGYHIRGELQVLLVYETNSCDDELTGKFMKTLHERLDKVVADFKANILIGDITCFPTLDRPTDKFNLQVETKVSPFKEGWDESCDPKEEDLAIDCYHAAIHTNLQKAKDALTEFLNHNKYFPVGDSLANDTSFNYTFNNTFFNFLEGGKCQSGYGQTQELEAHCPDCCMLCPPGTYSEATVDNCVLCSIGSFSVHYGSTACIPCKHNLLTSEPGASRAEDCLSLRVTPSHRISMLVVAFSLPPLLCFCFIVLFCYCFRRYWQKKSISAATKEMEQEEDLPASGEEEALLDTQEQERSSPMLSAELEYVDKAAAMFSPYGDKPAVPQSPEAAPYSPPGGKADIVSPSGNEAGTVSPGIQAAVASPPVYEAAVVSPPANEAALYAPARDEAAVVSPSARSSALMTPKVEESPMIVSPSPEPLAMKEEVVTPPPSGDEEPQQVKISTPLEREESVHMGNIEFPPSSPVSIESA
nr:zona pellucida-binding protein 2-like [Anolis sagrei ordinatus]